MSFKISENNQILKSDPIYNNKLIAQLINKVMKNGKKRLAQKQVYDAFEIISKSGEKP